MQLSALSLRHAEVLAVLAAAGSPVSNHQLWRWQKWGLAPRGVKRRLGRGRGTETRYSPAAVLQIRAVAEGFRAHPKRRHRVAWDLFAQGFPVYDAVRSAFDWADGRVRREAEEALANPNAKVTAFSIARRRLGKDLQHFRKRGEAPRLEALATFLMHAASERATPVQLSEAELRLIRDWVAERREDGARVRQMPITEWRRVLESSLPDLRAAISQRRLTSWVKGIHFNFQLDEARDEAAIL
jgi:hypothetical protein